MTITPRITPFLWSNNNAEEAIHYYIAIFGDSRIINVTRRGELLVHATFQLAEQQFMALNGGPSFQFTEAISLHVSCETQEEVDGLWENLFAGGSEGRCGWLKDKYGLSWQIISTALGRLLGDPDPQNAGRTMQAMLKMGKVDIQKMREAANQ